jgi:predicted thioesterase
VCISAEIKRVTVNSLITEVRAETQKGIIGTGEVKQVILLKSKIYELLKS